MTFKITDSRIIPQCRVHTADEKMMKKKLKFWWPVPA